MRIVRVNVKTYPVFYYALTPFAEGSSIFPTNNRDPLYLSFMKNINGLSILTSRKSENDSGTNSMPRKVLIFFSIYVISFQTLLMKV